MEAPPVEKIMLEIDGLYYPQAVFDSVLHQVMEEVLQGIIDRAKGPRRALAAMKRLENPAARDKVYRETMRRVKDSIPGLKAGEVSDEYTLLPQEQHRKTP